MVCRVSREQRGGDRTAGGSNAPRCESESRWIALTPPVYQDSPEGPLVSGGSAKSWNGPPGSPVNLPEDSGVAQGVAAGLRIDTQPVRPLAHRDARQEVPVGGIESVDLLAVAPAQPEHFAVRRDSAHIRTAALRDPPLGHFFSRGQIDHRDRSLAAVRRVQ